ncbi:ABC transporter substrate-binding protein [Nonomuraea sp. K274]|uniref:ABC transporter substrate-binding protein n=1 Tax=Nonomuraea cypriaca TaxID=1187855 RepID=A0A931ACT5_9ACTN|nr:ABC transporter substrate-binding protein [Nonomuraea cypriaca]MBF8188163.1 ABC transporter substrate-binding protein [Nonomuraea cypriaca]
MKLARLAAVLLLGAAPLLAACGGPAPGSAQGASEIRVITPIFEGTDGQEALDGLLATFKKSHPDVTVRVDYTSYSKLNEKLTTSIASGQPYDVMLMGIGWIPPFAEKGVLADLGQDPEALAQRFNERVVAPGVYDGKVYALPIMLDARFGVYRKDIFAEEGIEKPPANFEELREIAKKLTKREDGKLVRAGIDFLSNDLRQMFLPLLWANGGELFTKDGKVAFNSPEAVGALQLMTDIVRTDKSIDYGFTQPGAATGIPLVQGRAAMMIGHNNVWLEIQKAAPELIEDDKIGFFVIENTRKAMFQGGTLGTVSARSKNLEAAKALVEFLAGPDASLAASKQRGNVPALKELEDSDHVKGNPAVRFAMENLDSAFSEGGVPQWLEIRDEFKATIESALLGSKTPKQALDDLTAKAEQALSRG